MKLIFKINSIVPIRRSQEKYKTLWFKIKKNGYFPLKFHAQTIKILAFYNVPNSHNFEYNISFPELYLRMEAFYFYTKSSTGDNLCQLSGTIYWAILRCFKYNF